jgi:putative CocE/NonD family hydrolase
MTTGDQGDIRFLWDQRVPMRDSVHLSADIYLPPEEGRYPAVLQRTPYDNTMPLWVKIASYLAGRGYAFVSQDVRGRCDSEGEWVPMVNEAQDGYDTIEWIAQQPWCDGRVGMMGGSYGGYVQWMAARERPPHLVTLVSTAAAGRWLQELPYMNGKFTPYWLWWLNLVGGRTLQQSLSDPAGKPPINWKKLVLHRPLKDIDQVLGRTDTLWREWLAHPTWDAYWQHLSLDGYFEQIDLPVLHITGWYDGDQWGELYYYNNMVAHSPAADKQYLLSGPWDHAGTRTPQATLGGIDFTQAAVLDINDIHRRWFDYWLKGEQNGQEEQAPVKFFVMGRNEWREDAAWPLPGTQVTPYYFHSGGRANTLAGDGGLNPAAPEQEPGDTYTYNPEDPTPSVPDLESYPGGDYLFDQRYIERRDDVLVYTSPPLEEALEVTGTPFVVLHAASDVIDTDFAAVLTDVYPDGRSVALAEGIMRASYRDSLESPTPLTQGQVYTYKIEMNATSNAFLPGHRVRVTIMSARFPSYCRNPNTGAPEGDDAVVCLANQTVYHSQAYPSHILLPVIPAGPDHREKQK